MRSYKVSSSGSGHFKLWLRAYLPRAAVLEGRYMVPPVVSRTLVYSDSDLPAAHALAKEIRIVRG